MRGDGHTDDVRLYATASAKGFKFMPSKSIWLTRQYGHHFLAIIHAVSKHSPIGIVLFVLLFAGQKI